MTAMVSEAFWFSNTLQHLWE